MSPVLSQEFGVQHLFLGFRVWVYTGKLLALRCLAIILGFHLSLLHVFKQRNLSQTTVVCCWFVFVFFQSTENQLKIFFNQLSHWFNLARAAVFKIWGRGEIKHQIYVRGQWEHEKPQKNPIQPFYPYFEEISSWERSGAQFCRGLGTVSFVGRDGYQLLHSGCWVWVLGAGAWESRGTGYAEQGRQGSRAQGEGEAVSTKYYRKAQPCIKIWSPWGLTLCCLLGLFLPFCSLPKWTVKTTENPSAAVIRKG